MNGQCKTTKKFLKCGRCDLTYSEIKKLFKDKNHNVKIIINKNGKILIEDEQKGKK